MRMLLGMQGTADANIDNKHPVVIETRAEKDVEIAIDDGRALQKNRLGGNAAVMGTETEGIDIETAVATANDGTDVHLAS